MNFALKIITPEKTVFEDTAEEVVLSTENGEITILPNHVGLLSRLVPGELIFKKGDKTKSIALTGGLLEVASNNVTVLTDYAVRAEDIVVARAMEAQKRAEKLMREKSSEKDFRIAEGELRKALLEIKIASKYRRRPPTARP